MPHAVAVWPAVWQGSVLPRYTLGPEIEQSAHLEIWQGYALWGHSPKHLGLRGPLRQVPLCLLCQDPLGLLLLLKSMSTPRVW